jgi:tRNA-2-methylthio-N6-dimethylallyladenosine synthase
MNYADAARIKAIMLNSGFSYVDTIQDADIVIIDTCSVRQKSEDKVTGKLKEIPQDKKIWITGCMIQHNFRNAKISKQLKDKTASMLMKTGNFIGNVNTTKPKIV